MPIVLEFVMGAKSSGSPEPPGSWQERVTVIFHDQGKSTDTHTLEQAEYEDIQAFFAEMADGYCISREQADKDQMTDRVADEAMYQEWLQSREEKQT